MPNRICFDEILEVSLFCKESPDCRGCKYFDHPFCPVTITDRDDQNIELNGRIIRLQDEISIYRHTLGIPAWVHCDECVAGDCSGCMVKNKQSNYLNYQPLKEREGNE